MSQFEYFSVVISVVLGLGISGILRHFGDSLADASRWDKYWIHFVWLVVLLKTHIDMWWQLWGYREQIEGTPALGYLLLLPALLIIQTRVMLPNITDSRDLRELYYKRRVPFFSISILSILLSLMGLWVSPIEQISIEILAAGAIAIGGCIACMLTRNAIFHGVFVSIALATEILEATALLFSD